MRKLTAEEIGTLSAAGCDAADWGAVEVEEPFVASAYRRVSFSGRVCLGSAVGSFALDGGVEVSAGISDARLHNVSVGRGVYIGRVANYIANYDIADGAFIENVNQMVTRPGATFGVGTEVSVLNETGGREVIIHERLSAQEAYLSAMYRHDPALTAGMRAIAAGRVDAARADRGRVGRMARIVNAGTLVDVRVGDYARVEGATKLVNGTLASSQGDPVVAGANVIAENFIMAAGARADDGALMRNVFVGQGTHITHLFSAHDSLFFANCTLENGEACAVFAGPFTVSMHKSSLLIAGLFSFLNAGSGSNQSNHMYKLGPIHQGVVERGSKTTSDSYVLWPARIGAFSLVMGRHVSHPDTSSLPFSYLIENDGRSYLVPGVNLRSVGTIRDSQKWPRRDRRKDSDRLDMINFNLLSPYTISRMQSGMRLLDSIEAVAGTGADKYAYQAMTIEARALRSGRRYYSMAIDKFMGNSLIKRLEGRTFATDAEIAERLKPTHEAGRGEWVDLAGMFAPQAEVSRLVADIGSGAVATAEALEERFRALQRNYYDMEWTWVADNFEAWWGKAPSELTAADVRAIVGRWTESVVGLDRMLYDDARKEFSDISRTGFGVDGDDVRRRSDFEGVRGDFESDAFVRMVADHISAKTDLGRELLGRLL